MYASATRRSACPLLGPFTTKSYNSAFTRFSVCVHLLGCNNLKAVERIFIKFDIAEFH